MAIRDAAMHVGRLWLAGMVLLCAGLCQALAQSGLPDREIRVAPGQEVRVITYNDIKSDCTSGPLPAVRVAALPQYGAVSVKRGTITSTNLTQCRFAQAPVVMVFYRASDGASGSDGFVLELALGGRVALQRFRVMISGPGRHSF